MADAASRGLRVALIAGPEPQGRHLKDLLETNGLEVTLDQSIRDYDPDATDTGRVDVLLVNLDESTSLDMERLEALIERSSVPILFNEGGVPGGTGWGRKLISKLAGLVQARAADAACTSAQPSADQADAVHTDDAPAAETQATEPVAVSAAPAEPEPRPAPALQSAEPRAAGHRPALRVVDTAAEREDTAQVVWVLGASLGGPQALKEFLTYLSDQLPVGFVIAQHIGKPFVALLAQQLSRITQLRVQPAEAGRSLCAREVVLVPVDRRFALADDGRVELRDEPIRGPYKPCIDEVMEEVVRHYGPRCNAIVFSGMGEDGALGAAAVADAGGQVWAQSAESCVISSMPDAARRRGVVHFSATPRMLAEQLNEQAAARDAAG